MVEHEQAGARLDPPQATVARWLGAVHHCACGLGLRTEPGVVTSGMLIP
jgi:hypothetical protein